MFLEIMFRNGSCNFKRLKPFLIKKLYWVYEHIPIRTGEHYIVKLPYKNTPSTLLSGNDHLCSAKNFKLPYIDRIFQKSFPKYMVRHGQSLLLDSYVVKKFLRSDQHGGQEFWTQITPWGWIFLDHDFYNLKKLTSRSI